MADSAARVRVFSDDGHCVSDPALMRRALEYVKAFDGVVAQHAEEPRLTDGAQMHEGDRSARLGLTGWPAAAEEAIIARDVLLAGHVGARLHVCHVSTAGSVELLRWAKAPRRPGDRRGHPAPPAAHRRLRRVLRPGVQGQPAAAHRRGRAGAAGGPRRRHDRRRRHRPRPARGGGQGERVGAGPPGHARAGAGALGRRRDDGRDRAARLAGRRRPDVGAPRASSAGWPVTAARSPPASRPTSCCSTHAARAVVDPAALASRSRNSPYAGRELPGRVVATFLRGVPTVLDGKATQQ